MGTNTMATLTAEDKTYYDRLLLKRALPELQFYKDAQKRPMPKNEGSTVNFRRFNSLGATSNALTEGVTPDGQDLSITTITATVVQEGGFVKITDKVKMVAMDPVLTEAVTLLGEQAKLTIDTRIRDIIVAGTNVMYAGGKTSSTLINTDVMTGADIKKAVRQLKKKNASRFADGFYHAVISPEQSYDLMNDTAWTDVGKYANTTQLLTGEIGKMHGVRFMESTNVATADVAVGGSVTVAYTKHKALIYGKDSYGVIDIDGTAGKAETIIKELGYGDDPLNQRASAAWKALFTTKILDDNAIIRLESAVSA